MSTLICIRLHALYYMETVFGEFISISFICCIVVLKLLKETEIIKLYAYMLISCPGPGCSKGR